MAQFVLTLRQDVNRPNGFHLDKGVVFTINIPVMGITPINLFNNSRCKGPLLQQFKMNGIDLPQNDILYTNKGAWDIKMI